MIGDRLYVAGGARDGAALRTLEVYDFKRRRWSRGPSMRTAREHLAGTVHGGAFYVLAGRANGLNNFRVAERYVPAQAALGARAVAAQGARRDRRRDRRGPDRRRRRGGGRGHDRRGRVLRPAHAALAHASRALKTPRHGLGAVAYRGRIVVLEGGPVPGLTYSDATEALRIDG